MFSLILSLSIYVRPSLCCVCRGQRNGGKADHRYAGEEGAGQRFHLFCLRNTPDLMGKESSLKHAVPYPFKVSAHSNSRSLIFRDTCSELNLIY
jgi:hypothetical protein